VATGSALLTIRHAHEGEALAAARQLFEQYAASLDICVALRPLEPDTCEMKRLYVRPAYRSGGVGRLLAERVIHEAATAGYRRMRLDTLRTMETALQLYRRLGFREIAPYTANPIKGAVFLELQLDRSPNDP
jgi:ribosomal protein S18 acetylase RimI-like enzyme